MRPIMITPLLWKKFNRAIRRRQEGQALVLMTIVGLALVGTIGLAVDGASAFTQTQKLQQAADKAALAGVIWLPNQTEVANARGLQAVQSAGLNTTNSYEELITAQPGALALFEGQYLGDGEYQTTVGAKIEHPFLSALGIGNSYAQRKAVAKASPAARMGGASNYLGTSAISYDWVVRNEAYQSTQPERKDYYNTLWQRYIGKRCDQNPTPTPCVGSFWLNVLGPETRHENGDAYTPMADGTSAVNVGGPFAGLGGVLLNGGNNAALLNCKRVSDIQSWYYTLADGNGVCDTVSNNPNVVNKDRHPDSNGQQGFGYSIGITLDPGALYPFTGDPTQNYTSFKVSIYDAAWSDVGNGELFNAGDNSFGTPNPYSGRPDTNITSTTNYLDRQRPADGGPNSRAGNRTINCITTDLPANVANESRSNPNNPAQVITGGAVSADNRFCQNGYRTRFSLYYPPDSTLVTTNWKNKGSLVAAWEASELTAQNEAWDANSFGGATGTSNYCYYADTSFDKASGFWAKLPTSSIDATFVYACPASQGGANLDDIYWNATPNSLASFTVPQNSPATSIFYQNRLQGLTVDTTRFDPSQGCRSLVDPNLYDNNTDYNNAINLSGQVLPPYRNVRIPWNMRGADPRYSGPNAVYRNVQGFGNLTGGYQSYHGWRCSWDFDSNNTLNPGSIGYNSIGNTNVLRQSAEGIGNQPYLYISDFGYVPGDPVCGAQLCRITYQDGIRQRLKGTPPNVRGGTYLLQAQIFGGGGANSFAVKAEYENPMMVSGIFPGPKPGQQLSFPIWPTPIVHPITSMSQFTQAVNNTSGALNAIYDLAYIPRNYAGRLATLELWDIGDGNADTSLEILQPSGYGQKLNAGAVPYNVSDRLLARPVVCPSQNSSSPFPRGASLPCIFPSVENYSTTIKSGTSYFNNQWIYLIFRVPDAATYDAIQVSCMINHLPDSECYVYQLNYKMAGAGSQNDHITWQLNLPNGPIRLK